MKYILITGATGGIGKALVEDLLVNGFGVCAVGRSEEKLRETFAGKDNICFFENDLSTEESIVGLIKQVTNKVGPISGMVHCAGFDKLSPLFLNKRKDTEALLNIHVLAAMDLCKMLAKKGNATDDCSIILISSMAAHEGARGQTAYATAKGALEGFLGPAASELADRNIRLNIVILGATNSEMTMSYLEKMDEYQKQRFEASYPLGLAKPKDIVGMISFLLSNKANWITGQKFIVDGGHSVRRV